MFTAVPVCGLFGIVSNIGDLSKFSRMLVLKGSRSVTLFSEKVLCIPTQSQSLFYLYDCVWWDISAEQKLIVGFLIPAQQKTNE